MKSVLELLDQIRAIAQTGLNYADDPYNRARYEQLMELALSQYSDLTGLPEDQISARFRRELGYLTPKIGVEGAVFNEDGHILLVRRTDDHSFCLPCGWAEIGLTPRENVRREVWEETGLDVEVGDLIDVFTFAPRPSVQPHGAYSMMFHCRVTGGSLRESHETVNPGFYDHQTVPIWHRGHYLRAARAHAFWRALTKAQR